MPGRVGHRLGSDEVGSGVHGCRPPRDVGDDRSHRPAGSVEPAGQLGQRTGQAQVVEGGRAQPVDRRPAAVADRAQPQRGAVQDRVGRLGVPGVHVPRGLDLQGRGGERRTDAVVQVPPQPPPLLLAGAHQQLAGVLEVAAQQHAVHGHRRLPRQAGQQPVVGPGEPTRTAPDPQLAQRLPGVREDDGLGRRFHTRAAGGDDRAVPQHQRHRRPEHPRRRGHHLGQHLVGDRLRIPGRLELLPQPGQRRIRVPDVAVHQPVDDSLQPQVQRLGEHRDHARWPPAVRRSRARPGHRADRRRRRRGPPPRRSARRRRGTG